MQAFEELRLCDVKVVSSEELERYIYYLADVPGVARGIFETLLKIQILKKKILI